MTRGPSTTLAGLLVILSLAHPAGQDHRVQVGFCTGLKGIEAAKAAGFEYVELSTSEIAALSDTDYESAVARLGQLGLPTPVANLFLPASLKVTGPDVNRDE